MVLCICILKWPCLLSFYKERPLEAIHAAEAQIVRLIALKAVSAAVLDGNEQRDYRQTPGP